MLRPSLPFMRRTIALLAILFWAFIFWSIRAPGADAQSMPERIAGTPNVPWRIDADTVEYEAATTTYHARGNVIVEKEAARLVADRVFFNHQAMTATAAGHVVMTVGDDVLAGEKLILDLNRQTGVLLHGSVFLQENHFYIRGERIEKTGKDTYRAERAAITSCDGERPDWIITGRTVKVTVEGYGSVTHAVLKARDLPVLYSPYLLFPAKTRRQTGLLVPEANLSDRLGFAWDQPLFWAISDDSDATFYTHVMEKRGTKIGLEYRYALTRDSHGIAMADGLKDRKVDDGTPEATSQWGYAGDPYDRPNHDRYWLRAKLDQELPWDATAHLDLDVVSDQDYLTEFKNGRSGYYETRDSFLDRFGRDIDPYDENIRTNRLNINRTWAHYSLNGDILWNDNVTNRRWEDIDPTLQRLPTVQFSGLKQRAFDSGVFWDLDSEYTYFYREDGQRGHRTNLHPRAYLPLRWKNYLSVEPSAGWRQTAWVMDRPEDQSLDRSSYRQIYDFRLDLSTELSKVMSSPVAAEDRIRHSLKPRVVYQFIPDQDQSDLPDFGTEIDRVDEANAVTYSLTNTLTSRSARRSPTVSPDGSYSAPVDGWERPNLYPESRTAAVGDRTRYGRQPTDAAASTDRRVADWSNLPIYDYDRFCRFYLEQTYDIAAAVEDDPRPFSDVYAELDFNLGNRLDIYSDASFDNYESRFSSYHVATSIRDRRGDRLWVEHAYRQNASESINAALSVKLTNRLIARGQYERNLLTDEDISKGIGFLYIAPCWSVDFSYAVEGEDEKFAIFINLMGIGGFGNDG